MRPRSAGDAPAHAPTRIGETDASGMRPRAATAADCTAAGRVAPSSRATRFASAR